MYSVNNDLSKIDRVSPFRYLRIKACLPAPRSFSQASTSFVAFDCQGIHLLRLFTWFENPTRYSSFSLSLYCWFLRWTLLSGTHVLRSTFRSSTIIRLGLNKKTLLNKKSLPFDLFRWTKTKYLIFKFQLKLKACKLSLVGFSGSFRWMQHTLKLFL